MELGLASTLAVATVLPIVFVVAYVLLYNCLFHPLRKFPGPFLAGMTPIPLMFHKGTGNYVRWIHALHNEYGPVVRPAPDELSFIDPEAWKDICGHRRSGQPSFAKDPRFLGRDFFAKPGEPAGLVRSDDVNHARQRRLVSAGFADKALRAQEALLRKYVDVLIDKLRNCKTKANMIDWFNFTTFDIMADLTFGEPLHLLENSSYSAWVSSILGSIRLIALQQLTRQIPGLESILELAIPSSVKEKRKRHLDFSAGRVDNRLRMKTARPDIWTHVLRFSGSEENKDRRLSLNEMYSISSTFMTAGTETTATLLSGLTYMLLKHPQKMQRLVSELRETFDTRESMTLDKLASLEYLNACIDEALRVYPPIPTGLPRIVPENGAQVCGHYVAGGNYVYVSTYAAHHAASNFKRPDEFIPERWLTESQEEFSSDKKQAFVPFSVGPRNCIGKNLAYHEIRLVLANIFWTFDLSLCSESEDWMDQDVYITWAKGPLLVELKEHVVST